MRCMIMKCMHHELSLLIKVYKNQMSNNPLIYEVQISRQCLRSILDTSILTSLRKASPRYLKATLVACRTVEAGCIR